MKYAIVSDIHANLQAWRAVWADISAQGVDEVICLGDIIGYGPRPAETLSSVHSLVNHFVLGNHDAAVAGAYDDAIFTADAREMVAWTEQQLSRQAMQFFLEQPYVLEFDAGGFSAACVHGSMVDPEQFYYVESELDARACWNACDHTLLFVGHTHEPRMDVLDQDGTYRVLPPGDVCVEPSARTIVNVGSVGMPRAVDFRAGYCIYDTDTHVVSRKMTAYDVVAFKEDVTERIAGSKQAGALLASYDLKQSPSRETIDFTATQRIEMFTEGANRATRHIVMKSRRVRPRIVGDGAARESAYDPFDDDSLYDDSAFTDPGGAEDRTGSWRWRAWGAVAVLAVSALLVMFLLPRRDDERVVERRDEQPATVSAPLAPTTTVAVAAATTTTVPPDVPDSGGDTSQSERLVIAEAFWKDNPYRYIAAKNRFRAVMEGGSDAALADRARRQLAAIDEHRAEEIEKLLKKLTRKATKLVSEGKIDAARAALLEVESPIAGITSRQRTALARRLVPASGTAVTVITGTTNEEANALLAQVAKLLARRDLSGAAQRLAGQDGFEKTAHLVDQVAGMDRMVLASFKKQRGSTVKVALTSGVRTVRLKSVDDHAVLGIRSLRVGGTNSMAEVEIRFTPSDLTAREWYFRVAEVEEPARGLMRGLLLLWTRNRRKAKIMFAANQTPLGDALVTLLEARPRPVQKMPTQLPADQWVFSDGELTVDTTRGIWSHSSGAKGNGEMAEGQGVGWSKNVDMCILTFKEINLGKDVNITLVGDRGLSLRSKGNIKIEAVVDAGGSVGANGAQSMPGRLGAYGGGAPNTVTALPPNGTGRGKLGMSGMPFRGGGGAGYGGEGGRGAKVDAGALGGGGGRAYGDEEVSLLLGGSGGAGSVDAGAKEQQSGGGAGGGVLELRAGGWIRVTATGALSVDGGAGGGGTTGGGGGSGGSLRLIAAGAIVVKGKVSARGGNGSGVLTGGGGGGGGRISLYASGRIDKRMIDVSGGRGVGAGKPGGNGTIYAGTVKEAVTLTVRSQEK